ncbi:MAG: hypothetical protein K0S68_700, partial [Candidatus Saccharibacteria bacterium]|nr:hypothetical protein [Candidatus Saccharibacteria bacterium]
TEKVRVEASNGRITRVLGGDLTEVGREFYTAIAKAATPLAPSGSFQIWTDSPETRLRFQQHEVWETGTKEERDEMATAIKEVFVQFDCSVFGEAPARH